MGKWRGSFPPRRLTPPPVLSQFLKKGHIIGSEERCRPLSLESRSMAVAVLVKDGIARSKQFRTNAVSASGPLMHALSESGENFSWDFLRCHMKALWLGFSLPTEPTEIDNIVTHSSTSLITPSLIPRSPSSAQPLPPSSISSMLGTPATITGHTAVGTTRTYRRSRPRH